MFSLPFGKLEEIVRLGTLPLEGLILVLTTNTEHHGLLVYLDDHVPLKSQAPWPAVALSGIEEDDLLQFDGLAVGFDSLDTCLSLLSTHGPNFYTIRRLFADLGQLEIYRKNARKLAQTLVERLEYSDRRDTKVVELLLPTWLQQDIPSQGVALALQRDNLLAYLSGEDVPHWLTWDNLTSSISTEDWVLTFSDVVPLFPSLKGLRLTEWRPLLRDNDADVVLERALTELADRFWQEAEISNDEGLRRQAYALALERWLPEKADNHLVAVLTAVNFDQFLRSGNALYVSRVPVIFARDGYRLALDSFLGPESDGISTGDYRGPWFALQPLLARLSAFATVEPMPLEPVWYQAGATVSLAISLQGLANDLVKSSLVELSALQNSTQQSAALALRGALLIGLSSPWEEAFCGRYGIVLDHAFRLLDDVLLVAEQERESRGIQALRRWFACYQNDQLPYHLSDLQDIVHDVAAIRSDIEEKITDPKLSGSALTVVRAVRILGGDSGQADHISSYQPRQIHDFLRVLVSGVDTSLVTDNFLAALDQWSEYHHSLKSIEHSQAFESPSAEKVSSLLEDYRRLLRRLYALPHELTLLRYVCSQDMQSLQRLQSALRQDVSLHVELLTPQVVLGEPTQLSFNIANIGGRSATAVRLELEEVAQRLVVEDAVRLLTVLPGRGTLQRLDWRVLPQSMPLSVRLSGSFIDGGENYSQTFDFKLTVIRRPGKVQGPRRGNPFQAGVAVSGDRFFGRQRQLKSIFDLLLSDVTQPTILHGPRRMGKTSILRQIEYLLAHENELQHQLGYTREEEVKLRLWRPVDTSLQPVRNEQGIPGWYFDLFTKIAQAVGSPTDRAPTLEQFQHDPYYSFERCLIDLMNALPSCHLLILLDEWDVQLHLEQLGGQLRALMQNSKLNRVNWVFTSTWALSVEESRLDSPFYGQTMKIHLREMAWSEAQTMLRTLSEHVGVEWQGEAMVTLLDQVARRPYLIQTLGQRVIWRLGSAEPPFSLVTMEVINAVLSEFVQTSREHGSPFAFLWEDRHLTNGEFQSSMSWLGRLILLAIDQEDPRPMTQIEIYKQVRERMEVRGWQFPGPDPISRDLGETLSLLVSIFDALSIEGDRYTFSIPLAKAWFHHTIGQYADPWQFAWHKLSEEYLQQRRHAKEKGA